MPSHAGAEEARRKRRPYHEQSQDLGACAKCILFMEVMPAGICANREVP